MPRSGGAQNDRIGTDSGLPELDWVADQIAGVGAAFDLRSATSRDRGGLVKRPLAVQSIVRTSLRVLHLDRGSEPTGITATKELFVTNVLNGTAAAAGKVVHRGTVQPLLPSSFGEGPPRLVASTKIGSGFAERTEPAALVIGPTGTGFGEDGTLYVADTLANRIAAIPDAAFRPGSAGRGETVTRNGALNGPLGLAIAPGGDVLSVNSGDGNIVETTPSGDHVATHQLDRSGSPPGAGALFGLAVAPQGAGVYYVDDAANTLNLLH